MIDDKRLKKIVITAVAIMSVVVAILVIATTSMSDEKRRSRSFTPEEELAFSELLDTMAAHLPEDARIVSRISNERQYSLVYLQNGKLFIFDADKNKTEEIEPHKLNVAALVSHADGGILTAKVDGDETCIMIVAATGPKETERGLYRYDLMRRNINVLSIGKVEQNGSGFIVFEKELEAHFNAVGDKISEMLHNENIDETDKKDDDDDKPTRRRRSEQSGEEEEVTQDVEPSTTEHVSEETQLQPVPRIDSE